MYRRGAAILIVLLLAGCQGEEDAPARAELSPRAGWQAGAWTGRLRFEHDTTSHRFRLHFRDRSFAYPGQSCMGTLVLDSVATDLLRVRLDAGPAANDCGLLAGGVAELRRLNDTTALYLQYWPAGRADLYTARLRRPSDQR